MVLSFIIPAFNVEAYVGRCLDSIISQDLVDFEVILIDDGSTDKTALICQEYVQRDSRVKYFYQENQGVSSARNLGITLCSADYLWFVDADDFISANSLSILISDLIAEDLDLLQFGWNIVTSENCIQKQIRGMRTDVFAGSEYVQFGHFLGTASRSIIKSVLVKGKVSFDISLRIGEDSFFMTQLLSDCQRVRQIELAPYNYFQNTNSTTYNIPFEGCLDVSNKMMSLELENSYGVYQSNFVAFYLSLVFLSRDYKENELFFFIKSNHIIIDTLFFKKLLQNLLSYRYGFFRAKGNRHDRIFTLRRIVSFFHLLKAEMDPKFGRMLFCFLPLWMLDFCFLSLSRVLRFFYISIK